MKKLIQMADLVSHSMQSLTVTYPINEYRSEAIISKSKNCISTDFELHDIIKFMSNLNQQIEQSLIVINLNKKDIQINSLALIKWINGMLASLNCKV